MHPLHEEGVDDMASLTELHGGSIMYNLFQRYKRNQIYVSSARAAPCSAWSSMRSPNARKPWCLSPTKATLVP